MASMTPPIPSFRVLAGLGCAFVAMAQGPAKDPAPASGAGSIQGCITPERRTADAIMECLHGVGVEADRRLNATYQRALASLDPASQDMLRDAQRRWVAFREAEVKAQQGPWRAQRGTARRVDVTTGNIAAIDQRERELRNYLPD